MNVPSYTNILDKMVNKNLVVSKFAPCQGANKYLIPFVLLMWEAIIVGSGKASFTLHKQIGDSILNKSQRFQYLIQ